MNHHHIKRLFLIQSDSWRSRDKDRTDSEAKKYVYAIHKEGGGGKRERNGSMWNGKTQGAEKTGAELSCFSLLLISARQKFFETLANKSR